MLYLFRKRTLNIVSFLGGQSRVTPYNNLSVAVMCARFHDFDLLTHMSIEIQSCCIFIANKTVPLYLHFCFQDTFCEGFYESMNSSTI